MEMNIEVRRKGAIVIICPEGRVTFGEASESFKGALHEAIDSGASHLIVDGSKVPYIDSTGIGEMVGALRRIMPAGGTLGVLSPTLKLREILGITGLDTVFQLSESEDLALERLAALTRSDSAPSGG